LRKYQSTLLARRYRKRVATIQDPALKEAVAKGYHKVLAYKDEYEVARLLKDTRKKARAEFDGDLKLTYHMAPPLLSKPGADGRPAKKEYGQGMIHMLALMSRLKFLRGTMFDPFGYGHERQVERGLIREYEKDIAALPDNLSGEKLAAAIELAELPLSVRGFGPVKMANLEKAKLRRGQLLAILNARIDPQLSAKP
jgi:indolepyruvate ferredoxin oxidoreductase